VTTTVEEQVVVDVPVNVAYNQWTQFEEFPRFMTGVHEVRQLADDRVHWVAEIGGVRREWDARIVEQVPDRKVAWAAMQGATNAGAVYFEALGPARTSVRLVLEFEPEGLVEKAGAALGVVGRRAAGDLERFKQFIESIEAPTGAWRGSVAAGQPAGTPGVEDAATSRGDSGKAGMSGTTVAAGAAAVAAAGVAAAGAAQKGAAAQEAEALAGLDVVDVLTADHREVETMVEQILLQGDPELRRDLADMVIAELVRHAVAEEMHVYPAMKRHLPDGAAAVDHDTEEHKEIEATLKELEGADPASARFTELVTSLRASLRDHIQDEERDQFPQLRARVPRDELVELGGKVQAAKKLAPTRPHPNAPNAAPFHKVVGPGVGLVDRLRDKLSGRART